MPQPAPQPTGGIRRLFADLSGNYDRFNRVASLGLDESWRRATVRAAEIPEGGRVLDLACGTGDLSLAIARATPGVHVLGTDLTPEMVRIARTKAARANTRARLDFLVADALALPYRDQTFDAVTVGFGIRNIPKRDTCFREVRRVLKPVGRLVVLEFSRPVAPLRMGHGIYLRHVIPLMGKVVTGDRAPFDYLNSSIREFPDQERLAEELRGAGFSEVSWRNLTFGVVAVHVARR